MTRQSAKYGLVLMVAALFIGAVAVLCSIDTQNEQQKWEQFSKDNHCRAVQHTAKSVTYGIINGEYGAIFLPSRTTYACDHDYTVIRDDY